MTDHLHPDLPPEDDEPIDLFALGADDRLLDELGQDLPGDPDSDDVAELFLSTWRASLQPNDLPAPPPAPVLDRPRRRAVPMFAAAAAIVALLLGTAAIGSRAAGPDDMLWPLTQLLWPDRIESVAAAESAVHALDVARIALDEGEPPQASVVLTAAAVDISKVQPRDGRADLDQDYQELWTAVQGAMAAPSTTDATTPGSSSSVRPTDTRSPSTATSPGSSTGTFSPNGPTSTGTRPSTTPAPQTTPATPTATTSATSGTTTPPSTTTDTTPPSTSSTETTTTSESPVTSSEPTTSAPTPPTPEVPADQLPSGQDQLQGSALIGSVDGASVEAAEN